MNKVKPTAINVYYDLFNLMRHYESKERIYSKHRKIIGQTHKRIKPFCFFSI